MTYSSNRLKEIQKRLTLALTYYRIAHRLTANEITERSGINFYLIESGKRPITIPTIIKPETVFGPSVTSNLLNYAWYGEGDWSEDVISEKIAHEPAAWDRERIQRKRYTHGT